MEKNEKQAVQQLIDALRNLMIAAEGNNDYDCDKNLQDAVAMAEYALSANEKLLTNPL